MKEIAGDSSRAQSFSIIFSAYVAIQAPNGLNALALALYTLTICGIYLRTLSLLSIIVRAIAIAVYSIRIAVTFFVLRIIYYVFYEITVAIISGWKRSEWLAGSVTLLACDCPCGAIADQGAEAGAAALAA